MGMDTTKWVLVGLMAWSTACMAYNWALSRRNRRLRAIVESGAAVIDAAMKVIDVKEARLYAQGRELGHENRRNNELRERIRELNPAEFAPTDDAGDVIRAITGGTGLSDDGE